MMTAPKMRFGKTGYCFENAFWMATMAKLAYVKNEDGSPDEEVILRSLRELDKGFEQVHGYDAKSSQAVLVKHRDYVAAAFRGTDEFADWIDNVNALSMDGPFGRVHRGFQAALLDVWPAMREQYRIYRRPAGAERRRPLLPLWITGHSLGGAMATLAAAQLIAADEPFYGAYTFGAPRVGDREFARVFNMEAKGRLFRYQNNNDIVTRVPARLMGYSHAGTLLYITEDGSISDDMGWWYRFVDQVTGAVADIGDRGLDMVEDHNMELYLEAIDRWGGDSFA